MSEQIMLFEIGGRSLGLRAGLVREVLRSVTLTAPLGTAEYVEGYLTLRGETVLIVDVRGLLSIPAKENSVSDALIIVECRSRLWGFRVDGGLGIQEVQEEIIQRTQLHTLTPESLSIENSVTFLLDPKQVEQFVADATWQATGTGNPT